MTRDFMTSLSSAIFSTDCKHSTREPNMLKVSLQNKSTNRQKNYRQYSPTALQNAYSKIIHKEMTLYRATKVYGIPKTTLLDRISGRVGPEVVKSGPEPLLSLEEEARLNDHIKLMASLGYGYTRSEVVDLATDYAVSIGKRSLDNPLTLNWFQGFLTRWPDVKSTKTRGLTLSRAKAASEETIKNYFKTLEKIIVKYNLADKPQSIYNIDEKGVNFQHNPPMVVAAAGSKPPGVTSERSATVTIIGAGNALGTQIPPFIVFPGARMRYELLNNCSVGTGGTVSVSGWSNTEIFKEYLQTHFLQYVQGLSKEDPILIIYDGHKSHIALSMIEWAKTKNIILFVLPAHCSHILQPLDVSCFGPLSKILNTLCHKYMHDNHATINRYNIAPLLSTSYVRALSPENLKSAFKKTGIFPLNAKCVPEQSIILASVYFENEPSTESDMHDLPDPVENDKLHHNTDVITNGDCPSDQSPQLFFDKQEKRIGVTVNNKVKRNVLSNITSGQAITEDCVLVDIVNHIENQNRKCNSNLKRKESVICNKVKGKRTDIMNKKQKVKINNCSSPKPGPSGLQKVVISDSETSDDSEEQNPENLCCVCKRFYPQQLKEYVSLTGSIIFAQWGKCMFENCEHWVHLKFCCNVNALRRHSIFYCPCHGKSCLQYEE